MCEVKLNSVLSYYKSSYGERYAWNMSRVEDNWWNRMLGEDNRISFREINELIMNHSLISVRQLSILVKKKGAIAGSRKGYIYISRTTAYI